MIRISFLNTYSASPVLKYATGIFPLFVKGFCQGSCATGGLPGTLWYRGGEVVSCLGWAGTVMVPADFVC